MQASEQPSSPQKNDTMVTTGYWSNTLVRQQLLEVDTSDKAPMYRRIDTSMTRANYARPHVYGIMAPLQAIIKTGKLLIRDMVK